MTELSTIFGDFNLRLRLEVQEIEILLRRIHTISCDTATWVRGREMLLDVELSRVYLGPCIKLAVLLTEGTY